MLKQEKSLMIGLDVGGTKIEGALIQIQEEIDLTQLSMSTDPSHFSGPSQGKVPNQFIAAMGKSHYRMKILRRQRIPTEREKGYAFILNKMANLIRKICEDEQVSLEQIGSLGIGLPGSVDPRSQKMLNGNTFAFIGQDLVGDLRKQLGEHFPYFVENDANCFALAEVFCGIGPIFAREMGIDVDRQMGIGIILGTGCGGGLVLEGRLLRGRNGGGMEVGHIQLIPGGKICYCGRMGCSEGVLSGTGLEDSYQKLGEKRIKAWEIFELAKKGDFYAQRIIQNYQQYMIQFLANLTNLFDPDYFVFGGGLSKERKIYEGLEEKLQKEIFLEHSSPRIYQHVLGDSAGVIGAAMLPYQTFRS